MACASTVAVVVPSPGNSDAIAKVDINPHEFARFCHAKSSASDARPRLDFAESVAKAKRRVPDGIYLVGVFDHGVVLVTRHAWCRCVDVTYCVRLSIDHVMNRIQGRWLAVAGGETLAANT
jgi:hypothetical protein